MIACVIAVLLAAPAPAPAAPSAPASQPTAEQLHAMHVRAYQHMRAGQFDKAKPLMEQVYAAAAGAGVPVAQRPRALIVNHAIMDLAQRVNVVRAVRDLHEYLAARDQPDELATNVLGSALHLAGAGNPRVADSPLLSSARQVWARHNELIESSRPGEHRWGARWITQREFERLEALRRAAEERVKHVEGVVEQCNTLIQQAYDSAREYERQMSEYQHADEDSNESKWWYDARRGLANARRRMAELTAGRDYNLKLIEHLRRSAFPTPTWATRYEPIDPDNDPGP
jgi:hypothetical protein